MNTLSTPEDTVLINLTLTISGSVSLQTYGIGGVSSHRTLIIGSVSPTYLRDRFSDLTGGVLQTAYDSNDCNNDAGTGPRHHGAWGMLARAHAGLSSVKLSRQNRAREGEEKQSQT